MKRRFLFSLSAILFPFLINGLANSADLMPMKIGQKFIYTDTDSADPPNSHAAELTVIGKVRVCSNDYFHCQLWNFIDEGEIEDIYIRSTENYVFECDPNSGIECSVFGNETVGTTWTCGDDFIEIMEPVEVSVPYGGPYIAIVHRKYDYVEKSPHRFEYVVPGLGYVKAVDYWYDNPPGMTELTRICHDGAADFTSDTVSGSAPLTVNFTDQSCDIITSWLWDFGDGSTNTMQNPSHTYIDPGTFTVSLTVTGPGGSDTNTKADYIKVWSPVKAMPWIPLLLTND